MSAVGERIPDQGSGNLGNSSERREGKRVSSTMKKTRVKLVGFQTVLEYQDQDHSAVSEDSRTALKKVGVSLFLHQQPEHQVSVQISTSIPPKEAVLVNQKQELVTLITTMQVFWAQIRTSSH